MRKKTLATITTLCLIAMIATVNATTNIVAYNTANNAYGSDFTLYTGTYIKMAQSFKPTNNITLTAITLSMYEAGTSADRQLIIEIYEHTGTYGSNSLPTGTPLATSDIMQVEGYISVYPQTNLFTFNTTNQIELIENTPYVFVLSLYAGTWTSTHKLIVQTETSVDYAGNAGYYQTSWTASNTRDLIFAVIGELDKQEVCTASFNWQSNHVEINEDVTFDATASVNNSAITSYTWNFGDGNETEGYYPIITHAYTQNATYTVTLTTATAYEESTLSQNLTVYIPFQIPTINVEAPDLTAILNAINAIDVPAPDLTSINMALLAIIIMLFIALLTLSRVPLYKASKEKK